MAVPQSKEARRYYRVALQRLEDGRLLFDRLQRFPAAIYLAGYAVECILKALILSNTPLPRQQEVVQGFREPRGHNILNLFEHLRQRGAAAVPSAIANDLAYTSTWSVDLRYNPGEGDEAEAKAFLAAVKRLVDFFDRRIT